MNSSSVRVGASGVARGDAGARDESGACGADEAVTLLRQRLHRISGQALGIEKMIADGRPCGEVLIQLAAVQGALRGLSLRILALHTRTVLAAVAAASSSSTEVADELDALVALVARAPGHPPSIKPPNGARPELGDLP